MKEPTSGLEPLTCSLRVISHALQGFAQACKSPIFNGVSLLCLALCCTVLRSRWYQSGIKGLRGCIEAAVQRVIFLCSHCSRSVQGRLIPGSLLSLDTEHGQTCHRRDGRSVGLGAPYSGPSLLLGGSSGRSHSETCAGCIVSLTTPTRSSRKVSRSVSFLSLAEKASSVLAASYLRR